MKQHHLKQVVVGVLLCLAFVLGGTAQSLMPFARATAARAIVVDGDVMLSNPAGPAVPAFPGGNARLTYQGRLTDHAGAPINSTVGVVFKLYDGSSALLWTSAQFVVTPANGLFTAYLGDDTLEFNIALRRAAFIGVTVGGDAEMTPRQALNTVVGHSESSAGVIGNSDSASGVIGVSHSNYGVIGSSDLGSGVLGTTSVITGVGVKASADLSTGIALEIGNGGIKATGAGGGTNTFAFIHVSSVANTIGNWTLIDNALTNGDQNAMVFVTHVANPTGVPSNGFPKWFGVLYDFTDHKWAIYLEDGSAFPTDIAYTFNVMVIKR